MFYCLQNTRKLVFLFVCEIYSVFSSWLLVILFNLFLISNFISQFFWLKMIYKSKFFIFFVPWNFIARIFHFFRSMKFYSTDFFNFPCYKFLLLKVTRFWWTPLQSLIAMLCKVVFTLKINQYIFEKQILDFYYIQLFL